MNNRFKFRCGITIGHYDDDGNDVETSLLVNNVSIFDDGEVGFDRESLKEAVKEAVKRENLSKEEERTLWNSLDEYEVFDEWYQMPADFIEQCSGFKDKNRKLIYEGDLIKSPSNSHVLEVFRYIDGTYMTREYRKDGQNELSVYQFIASDYGIEVIGNIHKNPELLKEE